MSSYLMFCYLPTTTCFSPTPTSFSISSLHLANSGVLSFSLFLPDSHSHTVLSCQDALFLVRILYMRRIYSIPRGLLRRELHPDVGQRARTRRDSAPCMCTWGRGSFKGYWNTYTFKLIQPCIHLRYTFTSCQKTMTVACSFLNV